MSQYEGYRDFVVANLPQLKQLDGIQIENSERIIALQVCNCIFAVFAKCQFCNSQRKREVEGMVVKEEAKHKMERQRQRLEHEEQRARREAEENRWTDQEHIALIHFCIIFLIN